MSAVERFYRNVAGYWYRLVVKLRARLYIKPAMMLGELNTSLDILPLIVDKYGIGLVDSGQVKTLSGHYKVTTIAEVMRFVKWAEIHKLPYEEPYHNCPDYAMGLLGKLCNTKGWWGLAFGFAHVVVGSQIHSVNIAVAYPSEDQQEGTIYLIEPQDGRILLNHNRLVQYILMP
jgi:hypothetical protein